MTRPNLSTTTIVPLAKVIGRSPLRRGSLLIPVLLAWFALSPAAQAVTPAPDGGYSNFNTAEGVNALASLTTGTENTANGVNALFSNTTGSGNTANGDIALFFNTTGSGNTANGTFALQSNTTGFNSTAIGQGALSSNTTGGFNTANGVNALFSNTSGNSNIALGFNAGANLTTGSNNIDIGNAGVAGEAAKIRIVKQGTQNGTFIAEIRGATVASGVGVIVGSNGQLGTVVCSERFKDAIKPMDKAA